MTDEDSSQDGATRRREFLPTGTAAAGVALGGYLDTLGVGSGGENTIRVSTWSGTNETVFREVIKPLYEDETGNTLKVTGN